MKRKPMSHNGFALLAMLFASLSLNWISVQDNLLKAQSGGNCNDPNTVCMDQAWLDDREAPYILDQDQTTYIAKTNISTPGTAILVAGNDIVIDLEGNTITFGNDNVEPEITNSGFELGNGTSIPGWDISEAPKAAIAPNNNRLWGDQVLRLENFSTTQIIKSDPIPIHKANYVYAAHITPGGFSHHTTKMSIKVYNSTTNELLGESVPGTINRGFAEPALFKPTTTDPVRIEIEVVPTEVTSAELDYLVILPTSVCGIVASNKFAKDFPGGSQLCYWSLSPEAKNAYQDRKTNLEIRNGNIEQGSRSFKGTALALSSNNGITIDNVSTISRGLNAQGIRIEGHGPNSNEIEQGIPTREVNIVNSTIDFVEADNIINRMHSIAAIHTSNTEGKINIDNNRVLNTPQFGISVMNSGLNNTVQITNNVVQANAVVLNAYGIRVSGTHNFEITDNTVISKEPTGSRMGGRGLMVSGTVGSTTKGLVSRNYVDVLHAIGRENHNSPTPGMRVRNYADARKQIRDVTFKDNTIIARSDHDLSVGAYATRFTLVNDDGSMDDANIVVEGNHFKAIAGSTGKIARAFSWAGIATDEINTIIKNNTFESDNVALALSDDNAPGPVMDGLFINNTIKKSDDGATMEFTPILAGYVESDIDNIDLIDTNYENGAAQAITWRGSGTKEINIGWHLDVHLQDKNRRPLLGATVEVFDKDQVLVANGQTDASGNLNELKVTDKIYRQAGQVHQNPPTFEERGPHTVKISLENFEPMTEVITIDKPTSISKTLTELHSAAPANTHVCDPICSTLDCVYGCGLLERPTKGNYCGCLDDPSGFAPSSSTSTTKSSSSSSKGKRALATSSQSSMKYFSSEATRVLEINSSRSSRVSSQDFVPTPEQRQEVRANSDNWLNRLWQDMKDKFLNRSR